MPKTNAENLSQNPAENNRDSQVVLVRPVGIKLTAMLSLMDVANLHVICAKRNCEYFEFAGHPVEGIGFGLQTPIRIDAEGWVHVPQGPGLGVELDWDVIENHTVCTL